MTYETYASHHGQMTEVLDTAVNALTHHEFLIIARTNHSARMRGPGMRSTRQPSILGVSEINLRSDSDRLFASAELGGVDRMQRFVTRFPFALCLCLGLLMGVFSGWTMGAQAGIGFGMPGIVGWQWIGLVALLCLAPALPWLFLGPMIARSLRRHTTEAVDTLIQNACQQHEPRS